LIKQIAQGDHGLFLQDGFFLHWVTENWGSSYFAR
jgi:hypothetical protein